MTPSLAQLIETEGLPSPPGVAFRLLELYDKEDVEVDEIAKVVSADPVLASKLISYCNSPLLGRTMQVASVNQAVIAIGLRAVKMIGLSFSLMQTPVQQHGKTYFDYPRFWNRSLATAIAARTISKLLRGDKETSFLMGLMLNIGQLALGHAFKQEYQAASQDALQAGQRLTDMELDRWEIDRFVLGGHLLQEWAFPKKMADVIASYGDDLKADARDQSEEMRTLEAADQMAELLFDDEITAERIAAIKSNARSQLKIGEDVFDRLFNDFVDSWSDYAKVLSFDYSHAKTFDELESQARRGIAELSLGLHAENIRISEENVELQSNVFMDPLTGLKNRRAYNKEAAAEVERCKRSGSMFVMMVLDIDHFKMVNDQHGHTAGDAILIRVAETLIDHTRKYDSVFRIGGEEFVVILADCAPQAVKAAAERFRNAMENLEIAIEGKTLAVTVSIGVACCASSSRSLEEIFKEADEAMYVAKSRGRNQCYFRLHHESSDLASVVPKLDISADVTQPSPGNV